MKLLAVGDIHYPREPEVFAGLLRLLRILKPDALILCGDMVNYGDTGLLDKFLRKVRKACRAEILAVMGNHDFWLSKSARRQGMTSWDLIERYERTLDRHSGQLLWERPAEVEGLKIAGVPGWYDFSFAPWELGFTREDFLQGRYGGLVWMDVLLTRFDGDPEEVTAVHVRVLERALAKAGRRAVAVLHFAPFREMLLYTGRPEFDFWHAYAGSSALGEVILKHRPMLVLFGHVSWEELKSPDAEISGIRTVNVDSGKGVERAAVLIWDGDLLLVERPRL